LFKPRAAHFSSANNAISISAKHKTNHIGASAHPKFYENDFLPTSIEELHYVRSPFIELAALKHLKDGEDSQ
jgi:hypothetical protein